MKQLLLTILFSSTILPALQGQAPNGDIAIFLETRNIAVESNHQTTSTATGNKTERFTIRETAYLIVDLKNNRYSVIQFFAKDPNLGGRTFYVYPIQEDTLPFKRIPRRPSGELWYMIDTTGQSVIEDDDGDNVDDYFSTYRTGEYISGTAANLVLAPGKPALPVARRLTIAGNQFEQFKDDIDDLNGSNRFNLSGAFAFDAGQSRTANTGPVTTLENAILQIKNLLISRGHTEQPLP